MGKSAKAVTRGWLDMIVGAVVLAGALVALCFPVYLDAYDRWGVQINCGNGYTSQLLQATTDDQDQARRSAPATSYVGKCKSALAHRRAWAIPVAIVGALIVVPELVAWARGGARSSAATAYESWAPEPADSALHDAALLDRRYRSHRERPSDTTL
jgi:hypothetical protein